MRSPDNAQRNRARAFTKEDVVGTGAEQLLRRYGIDTPQARVLVCEGPSLLAWVGGFRDAAFTERELWLLERLAAPLRRRLALERRLAEGDAAAASLALVLEQLAGAAFVLDATGRVRHANTAGKQWLDAGGIRIRRELAAALSNRADEYTVHRTVGAGEPTLFLVTAATNRAQSLQRARSAGACWQLTPRQTEVLAWILEGATNARVGVELGIAERTVEVHISAILDRAQLRSRAELMAAVMRMS